MFETTVTIPPELANTPVTVSYRPPGAGPELHLFWFVFLGVVIATAVCFLPLLRMPPHGLRLPKALAVCAVWLLLIAGVSEATQEVANRRGPRVVRWEGRPLTGVEPPKLILDVSTPAAAERPPEAKAQPIG